MNRFHLLLMPLVLSAAGAVALPAGAADKPNILVIFGDDVGYWNPSHINHGMMGYQTPNIDRIIDQLEAARSAGQ